MEQKIIQLLKKFHISANFLIDFKELVLGKKIGEGGYGEVHQGKWLGQDVAIKVSRRIDVFFYDNK